MIENFIGSGAVGVIACYGYELTPYQADSDRVEADGPLKRRKRLDQAAVAGRGAGGAARS